MIKKLRETTTGLEVEQEKVEPAIGKNVPTKFEIPNEYSENILITDNDFILSERTSAVCKTMNMSFKTILEADLKREYQNVEFLWRQMWRQRPELGGLATFPSSVSQVPGKYLCFLVTRFSEKGVVDPEHVVLALMRLRDFRVDREVEETSTPACNPNRGILNPR